MLEEIRNEANILVIIRIISKLSTLQTPFYKSCPIIRRIYFLTVRIKLLFLTLSIFLVYPVPVSRTRKYKVSVKNFIKIRIKSIFETMWKTRSQKELKRYRFSFPSNNFPFNSFPIRMRLQFVSVTRIELRELVQ